SRPSSSDITNCRAQFSSVDSFEKETRTWSCSGRWVRVQSRWYHHVEGRWPIASNPWSEASRAPADAARSASVRRHAAAASPRERSSVYGPTGAERHATPSSDTKRDLDVRTASSGRG